MRKLTRILVVATVLVGVSVGAVARPAAIRPAAAAAPATTTFAGHGFGHGRGLGQWGSLGYAIRFGWDYRTILDHFYGGTWLANMGFQNTTVRLTAHDGQETIVFQPAAALTVGGTPGGPAVRVARVGAGAFQVFDGPSCGGPWVARPALVTAATVTVAPTQPGTSYDNLLQLCESGQTRSYRGSLVAADTGTSQATVNAVAMEDYLRGVVPRESPASWGDLGGGAGMNALKAQAVAARSYAQAQNRYPGIARICDTTACQVYGGAAISPTGGSRSVLEDGRTDAAVAGTAGFVREFLNTNTVASTEFSSSTGGYTAGGTFPAVPDDGDAIELNPNHAWTRTFTMDDLSARLGVGSVVAVQVTKRNGLGEDGGRALEVSVQTTSGVQILSGDTVRSRLGLPSNWFTPTSRPVDTSTVPAGGYRVNANGGLSPFGAAPTASTSGVAPGTAVAVAVGGPTRTPGYVLTNDGRLHPFGGAPAVTSQTWDFSAARDVALRRDGRSGYVLDVLGGIWPFGGAPVPSPGVSIYRQAGTAVRLVLRPDGQSGYVVFADGSLGTFGSAPSLPSPTLGSGRSAVGLLLGADAGSVAVVDDAGNVLRSPSGPTIPGGAAGSVRSAAGRPDGTGRALASDGTVPSILGAPPVAAGAVSGAIDLALVPEAAGYTVDFAGGLHAFGGAPPAAVSAYYGGWDIVRGVAIGPRGVGWVLDAYGGLHPFGAAGVPPPTTSGATAYWYGWDIARGVVLLPGRDDAGYVLDGWGGVHAFGGAPAPRGGPYWPGWDIARALTLLPDGTGGYVLDGWGGVHPFALGNNPIPSVPGSGPYFPGSDIARGIVAPSKSAAMELDGYGNVYGMGTPATGSFQWPGHDVAIGLAVDPASGWVVYSERGGAVHTVNTTPAVALPDTWSFSAVRGAALIPGS